MSYNKATRASRRRSSAAIERKRPEIINGAANEQKTRSLQSLQQRLYFTLKRPRTSRARNNGGHNSQHRSGYGNSKLCAGKSAIMESGLIQIPLLHCDYYESPSPLSFSSSLEQDGAATTALSTYSPIAITTTATSSSACSSITHVSHSPISSLDNSSDDGFSCDEVMSLVSYPDMVVQNVLDFMPCSTLDNSKPPCPDMSEEAKACRDPAGCRPATADACEMEAATLDQCKVDCPSSVEDDGESYRIDLCDFEPDVNALNSPPQDNYQRNYGGGVLCLRLDYEDVLTAWKERGESLISREPIFYPSPYLDPLHNFGYTPFVPHFPF